MSICISSSSSSHSRCSQSHHHHHHHHHHHCRSPSPPPPITSLPLRLSQDQLLPTNATRAVISPLLTSHQHQYQHQHQTSTSTSNIKHHQARNDTRARKTLYPRTDPFCPSRPPAPPLPSHQRISHRREGERERGRERYHGTRSPATTHARRYSWTFHLVCIYLFLFGT